MFLFLFCSPGGLTAVIWTDFIQTVIMLMGATALMIIGKTYTPRYHAGADTGFQKGVGGNCLKVLKRVAFTHRVFFYILYIMKFRGS